MIIRETNRLNLDLSSLWQPNERFTLRYLDLSEEKRTLLATRIKNTAKYLTIRKATGPDIQKIKETLEIFNPIIFGEASINHWSGRQNNYRSFGAQNIKTMGGWHYSLICKSIYLLACKKTKLKREEVIDMARTTAPDYTTAYNFVNRNFIEEVDDVEEEPIVIEEANMQQLERIRRRLSPNEMNWEETVTGSSFGTTGNLAIGRNAGVARQMPRISDWRIVSNQDEVEDTPPAYRYSVAVDEAGDTQPVFGTDILAAIQEVNQNLRDARDANLNEIQRLASS